MYATPHSAWVSHINNSLCNISFPAVRLEHWGREVTSNYIASYLLGFTTGNILKSWIRHPHIKYCRLLHEKESTANSCHFIKMDWGFHFPFLYIYIYMQWNSKLWRLVWEWLHTGSRLSCWYWLRLLLYCGSSPFTFMVGLCMLSESLRGRSS